MQASCRDTASPGPCLSLSVWRSEGRALGTATKEWVCGQRGRPQLRGVQGGSRRTRLPRVSTKPAQAPAQRLLPLLARVSASSWACCACVQGRRWCRQTGGARGEWSREWSPAETTSAWHAARTGALEPTRPGRSKDVGVPSANLPAAPFRADKNTRLAGLSPGSR